VYVYGAVGPWGPEPGQLEAGLGVVGLVAQDGAAGDSGRDAHQSQAYRLGFPAPGGAPAKVSIWDKASRPADQGHEKAPDALTAQPCNAKRSSPTEGTSRLRAKRAGALSRT